MKVEDVKISQSMIKSMRYDEDGQPTVCPTLLKLQYIDGLRSEPSLSMQYGNYFETKVLGANRDGGRTDQLPLTHSTQKKTADNLRIDDMAYEFSNTIVPRYQLELKNAHVTLECDSPFSKFKLEAHLDLVSPILDPTIDPDNVIPTAIIDTKLTQDLNSTYGDFCWGEPEKMNHLQAYFYDLIWELNMGNRVPFYYIVCEHGTGRSWIVIRKKVTDEDRASTIQLITRTSDVLDEWSSKSRFPIKPNYRDCKMCPIKDACEGYRIGHSVKVV